MTVSELIEHLKQLPQDMKVVSSQSHSFGYVVPTKAVTVVTFFSRKGHSYWEQQGDHDEAESSGVMIV